MHTLYKDLVDPKKQPSKIPIFLVTENQIILLWQNVMYISKDLPKTNIDQLMISILSNNDFANNINEQVIKIKEDNINSSEKYALFVKDSEIVIKLKTCASELPQRTIQQTNSNIQHTNPNIQHTNPNIKQTTTILKVNLFISVIIIVILLFKIITK